MAPPVASAAKEEAYLNKDISPSDSAQQKTTPRSTFCRIYDILSYTPPRCRYNPDKPFEFSMSLNLLFAFAGCFTVANLYYTHPILNLLARDFHVSDEQSSVIPTLAQAGYAAGLLFLCPMGDLIKRRPFVLWLVWFTATLWIGLCITKSFAAFGAITFITSVCTVTPQIMLPLVGDMAPPHRRATALSVVVSGMLLGMLMARLLSGVVAYLIGWRYIFWIAFGLQYFILILLFFFMPDYPSTNPNMSIWKQYPMLLWDIFRLCFKYPVLVQACLIGFFTSSTFASYWTTLTFLLSSSPYNYNNLIIGLFALIGIGSMSWGPIFARTVMEKHEPLFSIIIGEIICLVGIIIGTYSGKHTVVGPIIQAAFIDIGLQTSQIANRTAIYATAPLARNRVNTAYMVSVFCGQLMGTAAGNHLYAQGGWIKSGSASVGFIGAALVFCLLRGPHEQGWVGWHGGAKMRKPVPEKEDKKDEEKGEITDKDVPKPFAEDVIEEAGLKSEDNPAPQTSDTDRKIAGLDRDEERLSHASSGDETRIEDPEKVAYLKS